MKRSDAMSCFVRHRKQEIAICGVGRTHSELFHIEHRDTNLYSIQLGYPLPVGLGLALALPNERIVVLEGDGSILADLGILATIANLNVRNLTSIIFDNESYEGGGTHASATAGKSSLVEIAKGAGVANAVEVRDIAEFEKAVSSALQSTEYHFIVAKVELDQKSYAPLPFDKTENAILFQRALANKGLTAGYKTAIARHYELP
jgi:thiamine pyrophosphate-dependent acetolactate synthase large subunit-like protein